MHHLLLVAVIAPLAAIQDDGAWHVVPARDGDLFNGSPERLWGEVLRRQPPPLSMLATLPEDANLN